MLSDVIRRSTGVVDDDDRVRVPVGYVMDDFREVFSF